MNRNIELKARFPDLAAGHEMARSIDARLHGVERQRDTYFVVPQGRLKLRQRWVEPPVSAPPSSASGDPRSVAPPSQLIWYERSNESRARPSDYSLVEIAEGETIRLLLSGALGVLTIVTKRRVIYMLDNVRIHLDECAGLGTFLEFEAIVDRNCDDRSAEQKIARLRQAFRVSDESILSVSYEELCRAAH
jgi:adenylate cyclase class 2